MGWIIFGLVVWIIVAFVTFIATLFTNQSNLKGDKPFQKFLMLPAFVILTVIKFFRK